MQVSLQRADWSSTLACVLSLFLCRRQCTAFSRLWPSISVPRVQRQTAMTKRRVWLAQPIGCVHRWLAKCKWYSCSQRRDAFTCLVCLWPESRQLRHASQSVTACDLGVYTACTSSIVWQSARQRRT